MAAKKRMWTFDPRLEELIVIYRRMALRVKRPHAIGGALAMSAHGYRRHTDDVDLFMRSSDRLEWLRAARAEGLSISTMFEGIHYAAYLPAHKNPDVRIDLLFPHADPDISAVEDSVAGAIGGHGARLWRAKYIGAAKFMSDRRKDAFDFDAMMELGLLDPQEIEFILGHVEPSSLRRFQKYMEKFRARKAKPPAGVPARGCLPKPTVKKGKS